MPVGYWLAAVFKRAWTSASSGAGTPARRTSGGHSARARARRSCCSTSPRARPPRCSVAGSGATSLRSLPGARPCWPLAPAFHGLPAQAGRSSRRRAGGRPRCRAARRACGGCRLDRGLPRDPLRVSRLDDLGVVAPDVRASLRRLLARCRLTTGGAASAIVPPAPREHRAAPRGDGARQSLRRAPSARPS